MTITWERYSNITNYNAEEINELLKSNPTLIGHTYTTKQFSKTSYEYDLTNRDLVGKAIKNSDFDIHSWGDVQIIEDGELKFLVIPHITKCSAYIVKMPVKRLVRVRV